MEYKYDAENHVTAAGISFITNNTAPTSQYFYDANGKRTRKIVSGVETWFVYGIDGELVAEYNANAAATSPQKEYGYRSGQLLVVYDNTEPLADKKLQWLVADHLGTPRMVIDKTGSLSGMKRHDYLPFGEEIGANVGIRSAGNGFTADQIKQKFTGKRRDDETGLDFFEARYFSSVQGRFTSPDEFTGGATELFAVVAAHNPTFYAEIAEPQSLNKYTYCLNNPYKFVDPDGHQHTQTDRLKDAGRAIMETANGIAAAVSEANGFPAGDLPQNSLGRGIGKVIAGVQGLAEIGLGGGMIFGGGAEAVVTSPATVTGIGAALPAAGVVTVVAGVAVSAHGGLVLHNVFNNTKGARKSTEQDHETGLSRLARDKGGEKGDARRALPRKPHDGHVGPYPPKPPPETPPGQAPVPSKKNPCPECRKRFPKVIS